MSVTMRSGWHLCPECGERIEVPVRGETTDDGDGLTVTLHADTVDAVAHSWTHDEGLK